MSSVKWIVRRSEVAAKPSFTWQEPVGYILTKVLLELPVNSPADFILRIRLFMAFTNKLSSIYLHLLSFWLMQRSLSFSGLCSEIHTNRDFPIDWEPRNWAAFCAFCHILTRLCLFNIILGSSKYLQLTVVQDGWVDTLFIPWRKFTNSSSIHKHFRHKINTNKYCKHCKDYEN